MSAELCALKFKHYDRKQGRLIVEHGKGDKPRVVYLGVAGQRGLWRYLTDRTTTSPNEPLFATATGRHMDSSGCRLMISRAGERAGIPGAGPHQVPPHVCDQLPAQWGQHPGAAGSARAQLA